MLIAAGAPAHAAGMQAELLVEGDLRGHHSHGLQRLPVLLERMRRGLIDPAAHPSYRWASPAFALVDGHHGFGPVIGYDVVDTLLAREQPVAVAAIRNGNHLGMLAPYVERTASAGAVGVILTTSEALVHPWGGRRPMVGTNPIGIAVPTQDEPFVLDMSTGAISRGKVLHHALVGEPLQPGWAVDAAGEPTTDAAKAVDGAVSPFGGPKGYALGLAFELLVASLTGTETGERVLGTLDTEHPSTKGDLFMVLRPAALDAGFRARMGIYLDEVRASPLARGNRRIDVPGDRARRERTERLASGVPIDDEVWKAAQDLLS
ncbi:Ldh family oxidoreductase [Pseudonocardia sulfidoxydans]|uniref:Ldh family oxidoreductase n=1 Tax=Pseudonocardia sulfidoxydans TaxID=54011 RepID=UPI003607B104